MSGRAEYLINDLIDIDTFGNVDEVEFHGFVDVRPAAVPEPAAFGLLGCSLIGVALAHRRRLKSAKR
jgi:hypothetical protein